MKKNLIILFSCLLVGIFLSKIILNQYDRNEIVKTSTNNTIEEVYFFQIGVYSNEENAHEAVNNLDSYLIVNDNNSYFIYAAITKTLENKEKLEKYFKDLSYDFYVKKIKIDNSGFLENLEQFDILLKQASTNDEIKSVNKSILATYEEMINIDKN